MPTWLIASAAREGLTEPMGERLFRAHVVDGVDVSDAGTLAALTSRWPGSIRRARRSSAAVAGTPPRRLRRSGSR